MFSFFTKSKKQREEGQRLFELGVMSASQYKTSEAIRFYTLSIQANENPSPYLNRANLFGKRIRHYEALQDILRAKYLDEKEGNEFSVQIHRDLTAATVLTNHYVNGQREKLIEDLKTNGSEHAAELIVCTAFGIDQPKWKYNALTNTFLEYHFFNELDNIGKFDDLDNYPEAARPLKLYPDEFIQQKMKSLSDSDWADYRHQELQLQSFLCCYSEEDMQDLRRTILYRIETKLMARDFGHLWDSLDSECRGITREAGEFILNRGCSLPPPVGLRLLQAQLRRN